MAALVRVISVGPAAAGGDPVAGAPARRSRGKLGYERRAVGDVPRGRLPGVRVDGDECGRSRTVISLSSWLGGRRSL